MIYVVYPTTIPGPTAFECAPRDRRMLSENEEGEQKVRRRETDFHGASQLQWEFTREQGAIFNTWGRTTLKNWTWRFAVTLPGYGGFVQHVARFKKPPKWSHIGYSDETKGYWVVTAEIEIYGLALPPAEGDPYFDSVVLLLHGDGANGSTTVLDSSNYHHTVTAAGANALTTSSPKFGTASLQGAAGGYFRVDLGTNGLMTGDFTIEMDIDSGNNNTVFYSESGGGYLYNDWFQAYGGPTLTGFSTNLTGGTWHHLAISRVGSALRGFQDGTLVGSVTYAGTVDLQILRFGMFIPNGNLHWTGKWDEIRVTKGVGRYTSNFALPTEPWPDRA